MALKERLRALGLRTGVALAASALVAAQPAPAASTPHPRWDRADAAALLQAIGDARFEGLDPADYDAAGVRRALAGGNPDQLDATATRVALKLAGDYLQGHVRGRARVDWHIGGPVANEPALTSLLARATARDEVGDMLMDLLPKHPEYRALRDALARTPPSDTARVRSLRVNLERWRWMPRELGERHILVNVPGFSLKVVDRDRIVDERAVIVGKRATPTPQFGGTVAGVVLNPWWEVPQSIVKESVGNLVLRQPDKAKAQGYVMTRLEDGGIRVRQAPGPQNSLGQMKLVMPNPFNVYLHDTPAKARFAEPVRTFSHGCVRVEGAVDFAALLLEADPNWNRAQIDRVLASGRTTTAALGRPLPIWIGYFTVATAADGHLAFFADPYGRDAPVWKALSDGPPLQLSARDRPDQCPA
jgi:murein L,D-transpeptidase YcbB/YkuD